MYPPDFGRAQVTLPLQMPSLSDPGASAPFAFPSTTAAGVSSPNNQTASMIAYSQSDPGADERARADEAGRKAREEADAKGAAERAAADAQGRKEREESDKKYGIAKYMPNQDPFTAISHDGNVIPLAEDAAIAAVGVAAAVALAPVEIPAGIATALIGGLASVF
jgi:hypothetical protein